MTQFVIHGNESDNMFNWIEEHDKTCPFADPMNQGAIGGRFTYSFTPTSLGQVTKIKCACGEVKDVSEYDW